MKTKLLVMLLLGCLSLSAASLVNASRTLNQIHFEPGRASEGEGDKDTSRSMPVPVVTGAVEDGVIYLNFIAALGDLTITISDASAPVYMDQVTVTAPTQIAIPVAGYAAGEYSIELTDAEGNGLYGTFVLY